MAEYMLPAVLIGLVAVGGLGWVLSGQFAQNGAMTLFQGKAFVSSGQGKFAVQTQEMGADPTVTAFSYVTEKGNRITLSNFPRDIFNSFEVNGGQGTMDKLSAALKALAAQLLANKEIEQNQANAIIELANKGFDIGKDLGVYDQMMANCHFEARCIADRYQSATDGQQDLLHQTHGGLSVNRINLDEKTANYFSLKTLSPLAEKGLTEILGSKQTYNDFYNIENQPSTFGNGLRSFFEAFGKVDVTSMSPSSREMLRYLSSSIAFTAHRSSFFLYEQGNSPSTQSGIIDSAKVANYLTTYKPDNDFIVKRPAFLVDEQSGRICTVGQGEVQQGQCH
jgi:hypothetical protein